MILQQTKQSTMEISNNELKARAQRIKWVFTDVDGTLTDGCVYYSPQGELLKKFSLRDGTGFFLLRQVGIKVGIITGEQSPIVEQRANKLKVDKLILGGVPKVAKLQEFLATEGLTFDDVAYIGDDLNDVKLMRLCGLSFAVADSSTYAKNTATITLSHNGGNSSFREAAEQILILRGEDIESIIQNSL